MAKFKVKGTVMEELPEVEIEAKDLEEAQQKYEELYSEDKIESDGFIIDYGYEEQDEDLA
jgi:hypothetical protein